MEENKTKLKKEKNVKKIVIISISTLILIIILLLIISKTNLRKLLSNVTSNTAYESKEIEYDNKDSEIEAENMQDAIDELYTKCLELKNQCPEGYTCISSDEMDSENELKNQCPEGYTCISTTEMNSKNELKELISSLESKLSSLNDSLSEDDKLISLQITFPSDIEIYLTLESEVVIIAFFLLVNSIEVIFFPELN